MWERGEDVETGPARASLQRCEGVGGLTHPSLLPFLLWNRGPDASVGRCRGIGQRRGGSARLVLGQVRLLVKCKGSIGLEEDYKGAERVGYEAN